MQIILPKAPFFLIRLFTSLHVVMHSERARQVGRGETESEGERNLGTNPLHSLITISDVCGMPMNQPYDVYVLHTDHPTNTFSVMCCDAADKCKLRPNLGSGSCWCHYAPSIWHPADIINKIVLFDIFLGVLLCFFLLFLALYLNFCFLRMFH